MRNGRRGRYTLEFKLEGVRLVESGQSIAEAARSLGVIEQTLANWGQGASRGDVEGGKRKDRGHGGADGDQPVARGTGAGEDGARHPGKSDGILAKGQK